MAEVTVAQVPPGSLIIVYDATLPDDARSLLAEKLGHDDFAIWHVPRGGVVDVVSRLEDVPEWLGEAIANGGRPPRAREWNRPGGKAHRVPLDAVTPVGIIDPET